MKANSRHSRRLLILWMAIDREFARLASQWRKSPVTYYDPFDNPRYERGDLPDNAC